MCGIAGQYCLNGKEPDLNLLSLMSERLAHRGPDGEGTHVSGPVALAHRRLAIIDLSDEGLQPMTSEDGTMWLVFNGEIYNFVELRRELIEKGHRFHSKSDTEVILHAYEEWGHECLNRFNGMWAFALWDEQRQELFCARDRFGIAGDEVTYLGAHVVPPEYADRRDDYVALVAGEMLDACAPHATWIDVFCDRGAFDADEARHILNAGIARGLRPRIHANQLQHGAGVRVAIEVGMAA